MKKFMSTLISCTLLLSIVPTNLTQASSFSTNNIEKEEISDTITNYFNHTLDLQKDLIVTNNNYIVPNSKLSEFNKLSSEGIVKWYSSNYGQLDWYDVNINIKSIETLNDTIKVNVTKEVSGQYVGANVETSYLTNHEIYLKSINNKLLVEKDIDERDILESEASFYYSNEALNNKAYNEYIDNKINIEKEKTKSIDTELQKIKEESNIQNKAIQPKGNYNRNSAAMWAIANAKGPEDEPGNDCTAFVSRALNIGGLPQDSTWRPGYYAWIRVIALRDYLVSSKKAVHYTSIGYSQLGDIIQFYNTNKQEWSHSVIVTNSLSSTNPLVSAHSDPAQNVLFSSYYPGKPFYGAYRVLNITY